MICLIEVVVDRRAIIKWCVVEFRGIVIPLQYQGSLSATEVAPDEYTTEKHDCTLTTAFDYFPRNYYSFWWERCSPRKSQARQLHFQLLPLEPGLVMISGLSLTAHTEMMCRYAAPVNCGFPMGIS